MAEEKLDPRVVRTKEAIQTVFKQMVCEIIQQVMSDGTRRMVYQ